MVGSTVEGKKNKVEVTTEAEGVKVTAHVFLVAPAGKTSTSEPFTRSLFENALDKVSRTAKGKYADTLPSSEEFIKDKRREVELEDRTP